MITEKLVMHLEFIKKLSFKGSDDGMRFMLRAKKGGEDGKSNVALEAFNWPEPFCFEATDPELIVSAEFPFSEEGISQALVWLNEQHEDPERKKLWKHTIW